MSTKDKKPQNVHKNHRERMRERFINSPDSLTNYEILETLLFYAVPQKNTNPTAHLLIDKYGSVKNVVQAEPYDLAETDGVGQNTACFLSLIGKVCDYIINEQIEEVKVYSFERLKPLLIKKLGNRRTETFYALYIGSGGKILKRDEFTENLTDRVSVPSIKLIKSLAGVNAESVVIAHNHPSGYVTPSDMDDETTLRLFLLFRLLNIKLSDHIIVSDGKAYSYFIEGRIESIINQNSL